MPRIYTNGGSTTAGLWDLESGGWAERLKVQVMRRYMDPATMVTNLARSNQTLDRILGRLPGTLETYDSRPSLGIFMLGPPDALIRPGASESQNPLPEFRRQLPELGALLAKYSVSPIFVGLHPIDEDEAHRHSVKKCSFSNSRNHDYEDAVSSYAAENAAPFVDLRASPYKWEELLSFDGLHLAEEGHAAIASLVFRVVEQGLAGPPFDYAPSNVALQPPA